MTLKTRKILYLLFVLAFLIITPTLILYSLGYTLNNGFKLEKSGILVINTEPAGARIFLNNKPSQKLWFNIANNENSFTRTPAKIKNLKAGEYEVRVELPGYWPWTKKLVINPGLTTFAEDVYLFRNDMPTLIGEFEDGSTSFSSNKDFFVNVSSHGASLFNLKRDEKKDFYFKGTSTEKKLPELEWSPNNKKILSNSDIFFTSDWEKPLDLPAILGGEIDKFEWFDKSNSDILYAIGSKLYLFNTVNFDNKEFYSAENLDVFATRDNTLFFLKNEGGHKSLNLWHEGEKESTPLLDLPVSGYRFISQDSSQISLLDTNNKILYLLDPATEIKPLRDTIYSCGILKWVDSKKLIYSDGHEIWLYDTADQKKTLLARISDEVIDLEWHPSDNYIIFSTKNEINILELDNREKHNITRIAEAKNIKGIMLDENGKELYFTSTANSKTKLYKISIQ